MQKGVGVGLVIGAFVLGLVVIGFGLAQESLISGATRVVVELIRIVHLLLGLALISFGEILAARLRRLGSGQQARRGGIKSRTNRITGRWRRGASSVPFFVPSQYSRICAAVCSRAWYFVSHSLDCKNVFVIHLQSINDICYTGFGA